MGKIKDLATQIEENDNDDYMSYMMGISVEELHQLKYEIKGERIDFTRTLVFDTNQCSKEIISKISNLKDDGSVTFAMCKI
jgi:hypothetical protein